MLIIQNIRSFLLNNNLDACIIHMTNRFDNKAADMSDIEALCGFTGSAGVCIVTQDRAILCVDGRYEKQASEQIDESMWEVVCGSHMSLLSEMIRQNPDIKVAVSGDAVTYSSYKKLGRAGRITKYGFFDHLYRSEGTKLVRSYFYDEHPDRLARFRAFLGDDRALICDPSLIAWLFCLRMDSLQDFTPVPRAMAYVTQDQAIVFCDLEPGAGEVFDFEVAPFDDLGSRIPDDGPVLADSSQTPCGIWRDGFVDTKFPHFESVKSRAEIEGMRRAAQQASEAFERALSQVKACVTEQDLADLLHREMSRCPDFLGFSFDPIVASGANSSIIHYTERKSPIRDGILLIDVGGQYRYGTTDMTRTVWVGDGEPPQEVVLHYRAVKKSVEMFTAARFPVGTPISSVDSLARYNIWQVGMDYKFGTGHGVGCYANVHEYPSVSQRSMEAALQPGNIITVEPGIYTDSYGIRLENMLLVIDLGDGFLGFEVLGGVGYDGRMMG